MIREILLGLTVAAIACAGAALAQGGIKRTELQKVEFPDGYNTITDLAEVQPGGSAGRHTPSGHRDRLRAGGRGRFIMEGKPDQHLKAGDSYLIPAGVVHDPKTHGDRPLKVLAVFVVDKTKPLSTPAP